MRRRELLPLLLVLGGAGVALFATAVPGVFTIDEDNYLVTVVALRHGRLTLPGTDGLPPSSELLYFDPAPRTRLPTSPVAPATPPLYAGLALPFSYFGWKGLVALNTLAYAVCAGLVFLYTRRHAKHPGTAWLAMGAYMLASYSIEYAQAVWPHMLSAALCFTALVLLSRAQATGQPAVAGAAGLAIGLAVGVRYPNIVFALALAATAVLGARRRAAVSCAFLLGLAVPLLACSLINHRRLDSWNPISKGPGYLSTRTGQRLESRSADILLGLWTKVVDYSDSPQLAPGLHQIDLVLPRDPITNAYVLGGAVKKAWLQSAPWLIVPLLAMGLAWTPAWRSTPWRTEARHVSLVSFAVLAAFAAAGLGRTDGYCFNQRYFLELMPLMAAVAAWAVEAIGFRRITALAGSAVGAAMAMRSVHIANEASVGQVLLMKLPLVLALLLVLAWWASSRSGATAAFSLVFGACLGWAAAVHLGDDLVASWYTRAQNARWLRIARAGLPDVPAAVLCYWGNKDALGPLQLERDLVIADTWIDGGADAPALAQALARQGRRVFVFKGLPAAVMDRLGADWTFARVSAAPAALVELRAGP